MAAKKKTTSTGSPTLDALTAAKKFKAPKDYKPLTTKEKALMVATVVGPGKVVKGASALAKVAKVAKAAKVAPSVKKASMTGTVIKKVSNDVKVLKPGSRPLTQSATEKATVKAKAATKTPRKRAAAKNIAAQAKQEKRFNRNLYLNDVYKKGLSDAGYNLKGPFNSMPTAAQTKAANKARDAAAFALKWNKKLK